MGDDSFEIAVDGIDLETTGRRELARFRIALDAPAKDDAVVLADERGRPPTSLDTQMFVIASFLGAVFAVGAVSAVIDEMVDGPAAMALLLTVFALPFAVRAYVRGRRAKRATGPIRDRFRVTLDGAGLSVVGSAVRRSVALDEIDHFRGERRLQVVMRDAKTVDLPLSLGSVADNQALAVRLGEALASVRASAGGYRGPRIAAAPPEADGDDAPAEDEGRARRAR